MRRRTWILVLAGALVGAVVGIVLAPANDLILALCDGPTGGFRCDFKRILGWEMGPLLADAIVTGVGAVAGALVGLLLSLARRGSPAAHLTPSSASERLA